ncbi:hypothetical protein MGAD_46630 [Mycolicibacterium gadium]|uniref:Uncharacterized protein n=1 Tax=Mycolicibacterium gadium TaxID=1794 RepID=A0A7I7WWN3_MYCGU|nr:hypothetical protein MGAD_46630 [Mycolicibacterium gadium]
MAALFEAAVVVHADTGKRSDLFTSQPRHASPSTGAADIHIVDVQPRSAGTQEVPQLRVVLHANQSEAPDACTPEQT